MANPFKRPAIADEIVQAPDLQPQAQIIGAPYKAPTEREVAQVPNVNQLEQFAAGLSELNPALQQYAGRLGQQSTAQQLAKADEDHLRTQKSYGDAVREGLIEPGQSRFYEDRYKTLDAKRYADDYAADLTNAWSQSGVAQLDAPPGAFEKFSTDHAAQYNKDHLYDGATAKFSPKQLADSQYGFIQHEAIAHLNAHNTSVIVDERTKKGEDTLASSVESAIGRSLVGTDGQPLEPHARNFAPAAVEIAATEKAMRETGMRGTRATQMVVLGIAQASKNAKDSTLVNTIGQAVDQERKERGVAPITKTNDFITMSGPVRDHIVAQQHQDLVAKNYLEDQAILGTDEQRIAGKRSAVDASRMKNDWERQDLQLKQLTQAHTNNVFNFPDLQAMSPADVAEQDRRLEEVRKDSPAHAEHLGEQVMKQREHRADLGDKEAFPQTEMQLRAEITQHPGTTKTTGMIDQAMKDHRIGVEGWLRSHELNKTMGQADLKYHNFLSDPGYAVLESGVGKASLKDETALFGTGNIAATLAQSDFRAQGIEYLDHHPNISQAAFTAEMRKRVEPTAFNYNDMAREEKKRQDTEKAKQKIITDLALSETAAKAITHNSQIGGDFKNKNGEWVHQGPDEELQVMKAQAETDRIALMDRANASGILKEGHDAARRFNGKEPVADHQPANFDHLRTKLSPADEVKFQEWKKVYAPRDSGQDYDLRGAFQAGIKPDPKTGHWPDTFKLPNHPTFSDESKYAKYGNPGHWNGDTFVPAKPLTQAEADTKERAAIRAEFDRRFPQAPAAQRELATEDLIKKRVKARYMERAARENASTDFGFGVGGSRQYDSLDTIANPPAQQ